MYCKLFASLYQGTLRGRAHEILVFTNLLAHCDQDGVVDKHWRAIAEEVGLTQEEVKEAIESLEAPDPESRSPEEDGARIVRLDDHRAWGWTVVNYHKYRAIRSADDRRMQNREAKRRQRKRHADSQHGHQCQPRSAQAEAEAEAEAEAVPASREEARAPAGAEPPPPPPNQTHDANVPTLDEIHAYANTIGATHSTATKFWEYHEAQNLWRNRHDRPINWKQKLAIWRDDDRAGRPGQANGHDRGDWRRAVADSRNARMGMSVEDAIRSGREVAEIVKRRSAERRAAREAERAASGSSGDDRGG